MKLPFGNASGGHVDAELLSAYLDNQITPVEKSRIEGHLGTCPACRAELASLRQTVALLQALPRVALPHAFTLSTAQVGARRGALAWTWGAARALGAVAALVIVAALAVFALQRPGQQAALPAPMIARSTGSGAGAPTTAPAAAPAAPQAPAADQSQPALSAPAAAPLAPAAAPTQAPAAKVAPTRPAATAAGGARAAATAPAGAESAQVAAAGPAASPEARSLAAPAAASAPAGATPPLGLGGGAVGSAGIAAAATSPLPAPVAPSAALSGSAGLAYSDGQSLVALDSGGTRTIAQAQGIGLFSVASDRSWVAYHVMNSGSGEIWAVRWNGADAHLLVADSTLVPHSGGTAGNAHITDFRWIPGTHNLSFAVNFTGDAGPVAKSELWGTGADGAAAHYILDLGQDDIYAFAPGGKTLAVISRPALSGTGSGNGRLLLYSSDGQTAATNERAVLTLPAAAANTVGGAQLAWLPDGSALWAALPSANASFPDKPSLELYRVSPKGGATLAGQVPALNASWSPNGKALAYTQPVAGDGYQLILANADGNNPQVYARINGGAFTGWSPDNRHFIYSNGDQSFVGDGGQPQPLGSVIAPQWSGAGQVLYLLNQTNFWAVVSYTLDGKTATVAQIPAGVAVDVTGR
ncbi:MAG TPA: zf-HC2 domain-containing protein [Anaerolineae bacterium]